MNKYVKELVEYYFHNEKKLYENTWYNSRHSFHLPYYRQLQYQYNNDDDMFNIVNEEYHISDVFDEVIDVIEDIYEDNIDINNDIKIYTGYNYNIKTSLCKKTDNENIKYPIYIHIYSDKNDTTYSYVEDRDKSNNEIIIGLNSFKIQNNIQLLRDSCKHEFLHVREMYALENKDVLKSNKNKTPDAEINPFIWDTPNYFEKSMRLCYIFNKSEERARLNAVYEHVKSEDEDIDSLNNITLLSEMKKYINMLRTIYVSNNFGPMEIFNYSCYKYHLVKYKINEYHFDYRPRFSEYTQDDKDKFQAMIFELQTNYKKFKQNIQKIIYNKFHK